LLEIPEPDVGWMAEAIHAGRSSVIRVAFLPRVENRFASFPPYKLDREQARSYRSGAAD